MLQKRKKYSTEELVEFHTATWTGKVMRFMMRKAQCSATIRSKHVLNLKSSYSDLTYASFELYGANCIPDWSIAGIWYIF